MPSGLTSTGAVLEAMVLPALRLGAYEFQTQVNVGDRIGGSRHKVDVLAHKGERRVLISLKWQQTSGTAEQKVPFEVICLSEAIATGIAIKAYLVLGGEGWTLRKFYTEGGLSRHLRSPEAVEIITLESFVAKANRAQL
jgi:hypothetical protein